MTTSTVTITGNTQTLSGDIYYSLVSVKGRSNILFDFTQLDTSNNTILRANIDYGDGSDVQKLSYNVGLDHETQPITYYFALYGAYSPLLIQQHTYNPPTGETYFNSLTAKFNLELADNRLVNFYIPIRIAQPSYYDEFDSIDISSTQLVSVSTNDVFCCIRDKENDIINVILS